MSEDDPLRQFSKSAPPLSDEPSVPRSGHWRWLSLRVAVWLFVTSIVLVSPVIYRGWRISRVPDVGLPFDAQPLLDLVVPDEDNAWIGFRKAAAEFVDLDPQSLQACLIMDSVPWQPPPQLALGWASQNLEAIRIWEESAQKPDAQYCRAADYGYLETCAEVNKLLAIHRAAHVEVVRGSFSGEVEESWRLCRAGLLASQLYRRHGDVAQAKLGLTSSIQSHQSIIRWMQSPHISINALRNALVELQTSLRPRPWLSDAIRIDAIALQSLEEVVASSPRRFADPQSALPPKVSLFVEGEPVLGRRVSMLRIANFLQSCELPAQSRPPYVGKSVFNAPTSVQHQTCSARDLSRFVASSTVAQKDYGHAYSAMLYSSDWEKMAHELLIVAIALEIFKHQSGTYPENLDQLVPDIIPAIPENALARTPVPIEYSRGTSEAVFGAKLSLKNEYHPGQDVLIMLNLRPNKLSAIRR